jgi:hypothetical protein
MDNIKMDLLEIELGDVEWISLAQVMYSLGAILDAVMNFRVPQNAGNGCTTCGHSGGYHVDTVSYNPIYRVWQGILVILLI